VRRIHGSAGAALRAILSAHQEICSHPHFGRLHAFVVLIRTGNRMHNNPIEPNAELAQVYEPLRIGFAVFALLLGALAAM
jgi:hypothetical protein